MRPQLWKVEEVVSEVVQPKSNAFPTRFAHAQTLRREAPGYSFPHNLQDQTHRVRMLFGHNLYISSPNRNPPRFLVCRPLR